MSFYVQIETKGSGFLMQIRKNDKSVTKSIDTVSESVVKYMIKTGKTLCTAESCTGGMISQMITSVPGASNIFLGGVCSYSEKIKQKLLGVKSETIEKYTVYSAQTASEMSRGALELFGADVAIAVTGVAGPGDFSKEKPAGTVYVSVAAKDKEIVRDLKVYQLADKPDRETVRRISSLKALEMVLELLAQEKDK